MTVGQPVSSNFYPNNANTNGVAIEPNNAKATKNEKGVALPLAEADSFQSSTTPRKVATSEKATPPPPPTTPQGISPLMLGAGMLTTLLVGAGAVLVAGSNNWIELGQKAKTTVTKELPDAVAKFLKVTKDATDEVTTNAIEALQKEKAALEEQVKNNPANSDLQDKLQQAQDALLAETQKLKDEAIAHAQTTLAKTGQENTIQAQEGTIQALQNEVNAKQNEIVQLQDTIRTTGEQLAKAKQEFEAGGEEERRLKGELDRVTKEYGELQTSKNVDETTQKHMGDLKTAKEKAEQELAKLTTGNQVLIADMDGLKAENKALEEALEEASVSIYVLTEGKQKLAKELEQLKNNLPEPSSSHQQSPVVRKPLQLATFTPVEELEPLNLTTVRQGEKPYGSLTTTEFTQVGNGETLNVSVPPISQGRHLQLPGETHRNTGVEGVLIEDTEGRKFTINFNPSIATGEPLETSIPVGKPNGGNVLYPPTTEHQVGKTSIPAEDQILLLTDREVLLESEGGFIANTDKLTSTGAKPWENLPTTGGKDLTTSSEPPLDFSSFLSEDEPPSFATSQTPVSSGSSKIELPNNEAWNQMITEEEKTQAKARLNQKGSRNPLAERIRYANNSQTQVEEVLADLPPDELPATGPLPTTPKKESPLARAKNFVQNALGLNDPINLNDDWDTPANHHNNDWK
jgi:hypothetical protein